LSGLSPRFQRGFGRVFAVREGRLELRRLIAIAALNLEWNAAGLCSGRMIGSAAPALALQICRDSGPCSFDAADDREGDDRFRRVSPVAPRPREGPLTEPTAGVQPWPRERVLMPHTCRWQHPSGSAQLGGNASFPICPVPMCPSSEKRWFTARSQDTRRCAHFSAGW
jgi:hypothetical protein